MAAKRVKSIKINAKSGSIVANTTVIASTTGGNVGGGGSGYTGSRGDLGYTGSIGGLGYTGSRGISGEAAAIGYTGSIGGFESVQSINSISSNLYDLVIADTGKLLSFTSDSANSLIIPADNSVNFVVGQRIDVQQAGLGSISISGNLGVTVNSVLGAYLADQSSVGTLIKTAANVWSFIGPQSAGYTGSRGIIGYSGSQGDIGYTGSLGNTGYVGSQGIPGEYAAMGYTGSQGTTGAYAAMGYTGSAGAGVAAGEDTYVQYNSSGAMAGSPYFTYSNSTATLTVDNISVTSSFKEAEYTIADGSGVDIDPSNGTIQIWALGASRAPTASNFAAGQSVMLMIASGVNAVTWTGIPVTWIGGSAPTLAVTGYNVVELWKVSTTIYGAFVGTA